MLKHMWFFMWPGKGGHGFGPHLHEYMMDSLELGERVVLAYEDQLLNGFPYDLWGYDA